MPMSMWRDKLGKLELTNGESKLFKIIKCKQHQTCGRCNKKIPRGSFCLGSGYIKVCMDCTEPFINIFIASIIDLQKDAEELLGYFKAQEQHMEKNNILAKLQFQEGKDA